MAEKHFPLSKSVQSSQKKEIREIYSTIKETSICESSFLIRKIY